jgi:hypothetical protein
LTKSAKKQTLVTSWGRFVLGAFVFAWLNVAAQPCLMAMEMSAEPAAMSHHDGHDSHHSEAMAAHGQDAGHDCGHCSTGGTGAHQGSCAGMQASDCTELPESNIEIRPLKLQLKDAPGMFALSQAPPPTTFIRFTSPVLRPSCARLKFTDSPPLNLRYCVFLK